MCGSIATAHDVQTKWVTIASNFHSLYTHGMKHTHYKPQTNPHEGVTAGISHNNIPYQLIAKEKNLSGMLAMFTNRLHTGVLTSVVTMLLTS